MELGGGDEIDRFGIDTGESDNIDDCLSSLTAGATGACSEPVIGIPCGLNEIFTSNPQHPFSWSDIISASSAPIPSDSIEIDANSVDLTSRPVMRFFPDPGSFSAQLTNPFPDQTSLAVVDVDDDDAEGDDIGEEARSVRRCEGMAVR